MATLKTFENFKPALQIIYIIYIFIIYARFNDADFFNERKLLILSGPTGPTVTVSGTESGSRLACV